MSRSPKMTLGFLAKQLEQLRTGMEAMRCEMAELTTICIRIDN